MLSRFKNNYQVGEFVNPESGEAYFFYPHALEKGILDMNQLEPNNVHEANLMISNGKIPTQAGIVKLSSKELAAYDLVSGKLEGGNLIVGPSHKTGVDTDTRNVLQDGLLTYSYENGELVKVIAEVLDNNIAEWSSSCRIMGSQAIRYFGIDAPIFEVSEITENITVAKPKLPIF